MSISWPTVEALQGGTAAMRSANKKFLPQFPGETDDAYKARLNTATLFPAFSRTVEVLSAKPFSRQITLDEEVNEQLHEWCEDVDMQGQNLHNFIAGIATLALSHGIAGVLVDYPKALGVSTKAEEKAKGLRPYMVAIHPSSVLGWRSKTEGGETYLTQLRLLETVVEEDGDFGEKAIEQVRVLLLGSYQVWRKNDKEKWVLYEEGPTSFSRIPYVPFYARRLGFMVGASPLAELAYLNVKHWQSQSDQDNILHVARVPILFGKMLGNDAIKIGGSQATLSDHKDADLRFVEHTGAAIESGRNSLLDLEDQMRQIGAELLVIKPGNTSKSQTLADDQAGMCTLQRYVEGWENSVDEVLDLMCEVAKIDAEGGHVNIYKDFGVTNLTEASLQLLREMNVDGTLSDETLFREGQRRGIIHPDTNWTEESERIKANRPKPGTVQVSD
ncbi:DNA-binding protein (plasmid) [Aquitalea sp. USM4]|nr:DNA-binding protein [Aquitalea sp. USM4]